MQHHGWPHSVGISSRYSSTRSTNPDQGTPRWSFRDHSDEESCQRIHVVAKYGLRHRNQSQEVPHLSVSKKHLQHQRSLLRNCATLLPPWVTKVLVSDNGPAFISDEFQAFLSRNRIIHQRISPYHPASNGLAERTVQTLKRAMKKQDLWRLGCPGFFSITG